jgi:hypothetical protein
VGVGWGVWDTVMAFIIRGVLLAMTVSGSMSGM